MSIPESQLQLRAVSDSRSTDDQLGTRLSLVASSWNPRASGFSDFDGLDRDYRGNGFPALDVRVMSSARQSSEWIPALEFGDRVMIRRAQSASQTLNLMHVSGGVEWHPSFLHFPQVPRISIWSAVQAGPLMVLAPESNVGSETSELGAFGSVESGFDFQILRSWNLRVGAGLVGARTATLRSTEVEFLGGLGFTL